MSERKLARKFRDELKKYEPEVYFNLWYDTFGGHKKPFDGDGHYRGRYFAIEFKMQGEPLLPHQKEARDEIEAKGGVHFAVYFYPDGAWGLEHRKDFRIYLDHKCAVSVILGALNF